jgi:PBP1b-binding outer membrane lipoprotein LpoB
MKNLIVIMALLILMISCMGNNAEKKSSDKNNKDLVEKRILQYIDKQAMGMLNMKNVKIEEIQKQDDTTYIGIRIFHNPAVDSKVRITTKYIFPLTLDSVKCSEDIKAEKESQGEWIDMQF